MALSTGCWFQTHINYVTDCLSNKFIKEQLEKGYIRPSKSPYSSPFFFIKKKDGKLHPVQDYRISVLTGCLTHLGPAGASWGQLVPAGASWYNTLKLASCHVHRPCPNPLQSPHRVMTSK